MKYKIPSLISVISLIFSMNCDAALYSLNQASKFEGPSENSTLSGAVSIDFMFGLPSPGNQTYQISSLELATNNFLVKFTGNNYTFFPKAIWSNNIQLDSQNSINFLSEIYLGITQTDLGSNFYQYHQTILQPVFTNNPAYNSIVLGDDLLPSRLFLTYELHDVVETAKMVTYPIGQIGPLWRFTTISDSNIGTVFISAQIATVPIPSVSWLFASSIFGFAFLKKRQFQPN